MTEISPEPTSERRDELARALVQLNDRIAAAVAAAGRSSSPTLIAVTKTHPASDVIAMASLGVVDIGENRATELLDKHSTPALAAAGIVWHFIGQIQSRQAHRIAAHSDVVHSIDRLAVARRIAAAAVETGREIKALVQVSLDGDPARGGVRPADVSELAEEIARMDGMTLAGLMAVPPLSSDPSIEYVRLAELSARLVTVHPAATMVSAGMSGDLEAAVSAGATHLRVGTALLGRRSVPLG